MSEKALKILYLAAEVVPFAKTGGLADVAGSLPKALRALGHDVRVAMPRYGRISIEKFGLKLALDKVPVPMNKETESARIYQSTLGKDVPIYFIDNAKYYDREGIYMYPDDAERFIFFCRAALEMLKCLDFKPDIIHCNDWHTAVVPNWLKTLYKDDPFFANTATVYTIHNLAYQGIFGYRVLEIAGIDEYGFIYHPEMADLNEVVDFMARGIYFADVINTVSPRYAQEILTPEYGERLDPLLRDRRDRLFGILNGIDYETFNPATDPHIAANYDINSLDKRIKNKLALQEEAKLPVDAQVPLIGMISRLTDQKGLDILVEILDHLFDNFDVQFVLLGTGEQHYHDRLSRIAQEYPKNMGLFLTFNAPLAQRIYAGSDMFLMPSKFEPCGLGQMIAMHYGSVPIVRATGGLADTVQDYDPRREVGTGFVFERYDRWALFAAIVRALEHYKNPSVWRKIQLQGMQVDFSWEASARRYEDLYYKALASKKSLRKLEEYGIGRAQKHS
ncbi:MAG: glycogen synthase GlgA [Chloroflexi bacterium]|nr:MAG: glycogen synthase GlgA [Chloroflexota bacterium]HDN79482.1 glycogen synthase GlgA [Chloroflexota bacterium]